MILYTKISLEELSKLTEVPVRTIRYYIQRGLLRRPNGEKKGAYYDDDHLETLLQIKKWIGAGMSLDRIHDQLHSQEQPLRQVNLAPLCNRPDAQNYPSTLKRVYELIPGVELVIDPSVIDVSNYTIESLIAVLIDDGSPRDPNEPNL